MTTFHHIYDIGDKGPLSVIEDNIKMFLDWSFLNIGGFVNIKIQTPNISSSNSNNNMSKLKLSTEPGATAGTTWESVRKDWIYETGVTHRSSSPINISGVYLNSNFLSAPTGSGLYGYRVNYPLGRVIFNNPVSTNSDIKLEYSYRYIQVYKANDTPWWKEFQTKTYNSVYSKTSPLSDISPDNRIQLPSIVVEPTDRTYLKPYQLGSSENIIYQDILLHIFTENPLTRNNITDMLLLQKEKTLNLIDMQKVIKNGVNMLDIYGQKRPNGLNYHLLANDSNYWTNRVYIKDAILSETNTISSSLYSSVVRWTLEIFP
jgi:hypothetical protein